MDKLTLGACRSRIARVLRVCSPDASVADYINEAQERLMNRGKWVGTMIRYRFCVRSSCITLPRQIETVETFWIDQQPFQVVGNWYESLPNGPWLASSSSCMSGTKMIPRDNSCAFDDIDGRTSRINVIGKENEAAGAQILLRGYNENMEWIRSFVNGAWIDGEYVNITTSGTRSQNIFSKLTGVIKPVTNGGVWLTQWYVPINSDVKPLAYYEPDEERPIYRRYLVPGLTPSCSCDSSSSTSSATTCVSDTSTVTVYAKLRHLPVSNDNDFLIIGNLSALKLMVQSILKQERDFGDRGLKDEMDAIRELEKERESHEGDAPLNPVAFEDASTFGGSVENVV